MKLFFYGSSIGPEWDKRDKNCVYSLTLWRLVSTKRSYMLKQKLQVCLSTHDLLVDTSRQRVTIEHFHMVLTNNVS